MDDLLRRLEEVTIDLPYMGESVPEAWVNLEKSIIRLGRHRDLLFFLLFLIIVFLHSNTTDSKRGVRYERGVNYNDR